MIHTTVIDLAAESGVSSFEAIIGTGGDDSLMGTSDGDTMSGQGGNDTLQGLGGNDILKGGPGSDLLDGGDGLDRLIGGGGGDTMFGGAGDDLLIGKAGNDSLVGGDGIDYLMGGKGDDFFDGGSGSDSADFRADKADLVIDLTAGTATGAGLDTLVSMENAIGGLGDDLIMAVASGSFLSGGWQGDDTLDGGAGNDFLAGGSGSDLLTGGGGQDTLAGGSGADTYVFESAEDTAPATPDLIGTELKKADVIDLSAIDADETQAGDQAFVRVSHLDGTAGEMAVSFDSGAQTTTIACDTDGDGAADFAIEVQGDASAFTHFVL